MKEKTIITYGTFDLFHVGHLRLLKRLSELGTRLVVGISSDDFNSLKGKKSFFSESERCEIVSAISYVDEVFLENSWEQKPSDIHKYSADVFAIGDDWEGKFDSLKEYCEVIYLPRTKEISTSDIKNELSSFNSHKITEIEESISAMLDIIKSIKSA
ncbi:adenylyltransferase/cytidyltransferase family protein [Vibrio campbellii]|uniref:Adenylyltransferase/cytidyltransferase family protein n=1 Tax=Vibrio campbellii TaxID=680 RepID=A0ACC7RIC7_9VIBR|nr:adenylyltransferase/cytidyltransferase family protein [Vibrio campbellii]MCC4226130.1 adenylyltransferase/cytidyltransferase family protein [Vibrio campbellii]